MPLSVRQMTTLPDSPGSFLKLFSRAMPNEFTFILVALKAFVPEGNERLVLLLGVVGAVLMIFYAPKINITGWKRRALLFCSCLAWLLIIEPGPANEFLQFVRQTPNDMSSWIRFYVGMILILNVIVYGVADLINKNGGGVEAKPAPEPTNR